MDHEAVIEWMNDAQAALNLIVGGFAISLNEVVIDDISVLGQMGNHVIDLVDFVAGHIAPPTDREQLSHWNQFIALSRAAAMEVTKAASLTFDLTSAGVLSQQVAAEIEALTFILKRAHRMAEEG